jgi:hypothetical protein
MVSVLETYATIEETSWFVRELANTFAAKPC